MINAYIVDPSYIKTNYALYVDENIDDNLLNSAILLAQNNNLQSIIGYTMFRFIIDKLISDPTGNSFSNQYLYIIENYIQPSVGLWALYQALPTIWIRITNKSVVNKKGDDSEPVNMKAFSLLRDEIRNNAMFYDSRIVEYITNNTNDFNEYYTTDGVNRIFPKNSAYSNGVYLKPYQRQRVNIEDQRGSGKGFPLNWN